VQHPKSRVSQSLRRRKDGSFAKCQDELGLKPGFTCSFLNNGGGASRRPLEAEGRGDMAA
jgi:hypothetical protein